MQKIECILKPTMIMTGGGQNQLRSRKKLLKHDRKWREKKNQNRVLGVTNNYDSPDAIPAI